MLKTTKLDQGVNKKVVITVLLITLILVFSFSQTFKAASWSHYDGKIDAVIFEYNDISGFLTKVGGYMEVYYQDTDKVVHGPIIFNDLSGTYNATANGVHTIRFYLPNGKKYGMNFYQTKVNQVRNDTWLDEENNTFGYDGADNFGIDPNQ